jgi:hypothetical protein
VCAAGLCGGGVCGGVCVCVCWGGGGGELGPKEPNCRRSVCVAVRRWGGGGGAGRGGGPPGKNGRPVVGGGLCGSAHRSNR